MKPDMALPFGERRAHPRYQPTKDLIATAKKVELGRCEECEHTEFCQSCGFDGPSCICQPKLSPPCRPTHWMPLPDPPKEPQ